jgi:hypothetical protein
MIQSAEMSFQRSLAVARPTLHATTGINVLLITRKNLLKEWKKIKY